MAEDGDKKGPSPKQEEEPPKAEEEGGWKKFIWDGDTNEFLTRTGRSWLEIFIFYMIFFGSLAAFFILSYYISLLFIDKDEPFRSNPGSIDYGHTLHRYGPGLSYRPVADRINNPKSNVIWFGTGSYEEYGFYSNQLYQWLKNSKYYMDPKYGECNGADRAFGYSRGEPCLLLKVNRIINFYPKGLNREHLRKDGRLPADAPALFRNKYKIYPPAAFREFLSSAKDFPFDSDENLKKHIILWCEGENLHDKENLGSIEYFPGPYIKIKDYIWKVKKNKKKSHNVTKYDGSVMTNVRYHTPFVMLKLNRPMPGALITIVCQAYADNISTRKEEKVGYVRFQVMVG